MKNFKINHMVSKHDSKNVKWHGSIYFQLSGATTIQQAKTGVKLQKKKSK